MPANITADTAPSTTICALLDGMLASDLLLFSFPLYSYGMPAMLKNLIDRMLPLSSMAMAQVNGRYVHVEGLLAPQIHDDMRLRLPKQ